MTEIIGVDWAKGSGMNRGEVIKRDDNVTHVRFKTVCFSNSTTGELAPEFDMMKYLLPPTIQPWQLHLMEALTCEPKKQTFIYRKPSVSLPPINFKKLYETLDKWEKETDD